MRKRCEIVEVENWCRLHKGQIKPAILIQLVCNELGTSEEELGSGSKKLHISEARHCYSWFSRMLTYETFEMIGNRYNRSHEAVIGQIRRVNDLLSGGDEKLANHIINIYNSLQQLL